MPILLSHMDRIRNTQMTPCEFQCLKRNSTFWRNVSLGASKLFYTVWHVDNDKFVHRDRTEDANISICLLLKPSYLQRQLNKSTTKKHFRWIPIKILTRCLPNYLKHFLAINRRNLLHITSRTWELCDTWFNRRHGKINNTDNELIDTWGFTSETWRHGNL